MSYNKYPSPLLSLVLLAFLLLGSHDVHLIQAAEEPALLEAAYQLNVANGDCSRSSSEYPLIAVLCGQDGIPILQQDDEASNDDDNLYCHLIHEPQDSGSVPSMSLGCKYPSSGKNLPANFSVVVRCQGTTKEARALVFAGVVEGCPNGTTMSLNPICQDHQENSTPPLEQVGCRNLTTLDVEAGTFGTCTSYPLDENGLAQGSVATTTTWTKNKEFNTTPEPCLWQVPIPKYSPGTLLEASYEVSFSGNVPDVDVCAPEFGTVTVSCGNGGLLNDPQGTTNEPWVCDNAHCSHQAEVLDMFSPDHDTSTIVTSHTCFGESLEALELQVEWLPIFFCPNGTEKRFYQVQIQQVCETGETPALVVETATSSQPQAIKGRLGVKSPTDSTCFHVAALEEWKEEEENPSSSARPLTSLALLPLLFQFLSLAGAGTSF